MLRATALVIFPSFQSGLHPPNHGRALQSSADLRLPVDGNLDDAGRSGREKLLRAEINWIFGEAKILQDKQVGLQMCPNLVNQISDLENILN